MKPSEKATMRSGYFMMPMHPPGSFLADTLDYDLRQVERLDALGFDEAWIGEHFTAEWENIPSPEIFIAAALQRTKQIKLGTGVTCLPNHNPFHLAHRIAQIDHMGRGRFMWGVGSGGFIGDFQVMDIDPASGVQRKITMDAVDTVLKLWSDPEPGSYAAHSWKYTVPTEDLTVAKHVHVKPFQQPHPPIAVAGVSEKSDTLAMAGERGWWPISINFVPTRVLTTHWQGYADAATKAGRTPKRSDWRISRTIHVAETNEQAREEAIEGSVGRDFTRYFIPLLGQGRGLNALKVDPSMPDSQISTEYMIDSGTFIVGDPATVAAKLRRLYEEVGGFGGVLALAQDWPDFSIWDRSMTLLATEVLPKLSDLKGE
jgi:alkanesulfonate monooxygenase SsuD/methylene tetrahydromethanopterin reductase-like flavin-dependent oxidoreductase (luciferase family)